jgi:predicted nucleic acid-binding Zn ribbon protein
MENLFATILSANKIIMPEYTYFCEKCKKKFSIICSISNYQEEYKCEKCGVKCNRSYQDDILTCNTSIKKSDSELKTIGDLANRNRDKLSDDQKMSLYQKHNSYKEEQSQKALPKGMSRIKKPPKTIWR